MWTLMITPFEQNLVKAFSAFIAVWISTGLPLDSISLHEVGMEILRKDKFVRNNVPLEMIESDN